MIVVDLPLARLCHGFVERACSNWQKHECLHGQRNHHRQSLAFSVVHDSATDSNFGAHSGRSMRMSACSLEFCSLDDGPVAGDTGWVRGTLKEAMK